MARAGRTCTGCHTIIRTGSRCTDCARAADQARGTVKQRGYSGTGHRTFRAAVLARDPVCVLCHRAPSTAADHWPRSRRELQAAGADPNDPRHGRGLCKRCHDSHTGHAQPGGWHAMSE